MKTNVMNYKLDSFLLYGQLNSYGITVRRITWFIPDQAGEYVKLIIYLCFLSQGKRQETQQLEEMHTIMSFHEAQVVFYQTRFGFSWRRGEMFAQGAIPQSDDSLVDRMFFRDPDKKDGKIVPLKAVRKISRTSLSCQYLSI